MSGGQLEAWIQLGQVRSLSSALSSTLIMLHGMTMATAHILESGNNSGSGAEKIGKMGFLDARRLDILRSQIISNSITDAFDLFKAYSLIHFFGINDCGFFGNVVDSKYICHSRAWLLHDSEISS